MNFEKKNIWNVFARLLLIFVRISTACVLSWFWLKKLQLKNEINTERSFIFRNIFLTKLAKKNGIAKLTHKRSQICHLHHKNDKRNDLFSSDAQVHHCLDTFHHKTHTTDDPYGTWKTYTTEFNGKTNVLHLNTKN